MSQFLILLLYISHNAEQIWHIIEQAIINGMRQFIPFGKFHAHHQPPWFSSDIRYLINHLRTMHRRFRNHPTNPIDEKLTHLRYYYTKRLVKVNLTINHL